MKKNKINNIILAGVGGQGILRASDILCMALMVSGFDVKKSEVHGMAQRGGCVISHVRYGEKVYSPLSSKGDVDILVSFEKLETLRYLDYMKPDGKLIINTDELNPPSVNLGEAVYPKDVLQLVKKYFKTVKIIKATDLAIKAGDIRTANTVLLGALSLFLPVQIKIWEKILHEVFLQKTININLNAFKLGISA
jgi:indolepyruvate ferredoxin oxidoreductase beta subunit